MTERDRVREILDLAAKSSLIDAVKTIGPTDEEIDQILDLVEEAATADRQKRGPKRPSLLSLILGLIEKQTETERSFERLEYLALAQESRLTNLCIAVDGLLDAVHPGSPHRAGRRADDDAAHTKILSMAKRRPPLGVVTPKRPKGA